jgi:ATP-binding cassette subfamily C protein CydC
VKPLLVIGRLLIGAVPWAMARGAALSVFVLVMGAALLGLSGWFIVAAGLAGLAGLGVAFDVFRPSAGVRFLALGRAAARYGERLLTHDATLRAVAALRVALLRKRAARDARGLSAMRGEEALARITADVDALDGLALRLALPVAAAVAAHAIAFAGLCWIVDWRVALVVAAAYLPAAVVLTLLGMRGRAPSDEAEIAEQALRRGVIDMLRDRETLILCGGLARREAKLLASDARARSAVSALDRARRDASARLSTLIAIAAGAAMLAGGALLSKAAVDPAVAAIGVFVALALGETVLPLQRGVSEIGRMAGAAARVSDAADGADAENRAEGAPIAAQPVLELRSAKAKISVRAGEAMAITGPSGCGKTSLLFEIAGLAPSDAVRICGCAPQGWPEPAFRDAVAMVPQRSALVAGTVRDNMTLAVDCADKALHQALRAVALDQALAARGGLDYRLGEAGEGLSGGEAKRLCIARALTKQPKLLLLDEPTEGLDAETAHRVLDGVRRALPDAAIVAALHRGADHPIFTNSMKL